MSRLFMVHCVVRESFDNINQTERSIVKIRLFCFNANCTLSFIQRN